MCFVFCSCLSSGKTQNTPKKDLKIYVIDTAGQVWSFPDLRPEHIGTACFTPSNEALATLNSPNKQARIASAAGSSMMFKFADPRSATPYVLGSTVINKSKFGGKTLYYMPHSESWGINFLQRGQQPKRRMPTWQQGTGGVCT